MIRGIASSPQNREDKCIISPKYVCWYRELLITQLDARDTRKLFVFGFMEQVEKVYLHTSILNSKLVDCLKKKDIGFYLQQFDLYVWDGLLLLKRTRFIRFRLYLCINT